MRKISPVLSLSTWRSLAATLAAVLFLAGPVLAGGHGGEGGEGSGGEKKKPAVHKITQSESYLMVDPFYTTIMDGSRPEGLLMVGIGLDVPNVGLREQVDREMPRLRDAYVRTLMVFAATNVHSWRQPDVVAIAERLQRTTDLVLKKKGARILLAQVAIHLNK